MRDAETTRADFLETAKKLFADKGFYGVSIAAISAELGLTKQALLHHFGTKEKLYGCVLEGISERFMTVTGATDDTLETALTRLFNHMQAEPADARIIMRELLDNAERADKSQKWYLRPFLDHLTTLGRRHPGWTGRSEAEIFASIYQIVGAVNYFAISAPTLSRMYGPAHLDQISTLFPSALLDSTNR